MATVKCPVCDVTVKSENLERHVGRQHPRDEVDLSRVLSDEERRRLKRAKAPQRPLMTKRGKRLSLVFAILLVIAFVLIAFNPFRADVQVGDRAKDFTVRTCPLNSSDFVQFELFRTDAVVLLELMDVHCGGCKAAAGMTLRYVYLNYSTRVRFLSISLIDWVAPSDTCADIEDFKTDYHTPWKYGMDTNRDVRSKYGPQVTPTAYVINRQGTVTWKHEGYQPGDYALYAAALEAALNP